MLKNMCGRYTLTKAPLSVPRAEGDPLPVAAPDEASFEPRFNIAPTQQNLVIRPTAEGGNLQAAFLRWGLIPSWSKDDGNRPLLINAKAETAADKPSFKAAYRRRRCLVPADGFYEWKRSGKTPQPQYFQMASEEIFFMAGLWEAWQSEQGHCIESYTVLTTRPNKLVSRYHDRMPAILPTKRIEAWLEGDEAINDSAERLTFFEPIETEAMKCRAVSHYVNSNKNEGPDCLNPPEVERKTQLDLGL